MVGSVGTTMIDLVCSAKEFGIQSADNKESLRAFKKGRFAALSPSSHNVIVNPVFWWGGQCMFRFKCVFV